MAAGDIAWIVGAYLIGSFPTGRLIGRRVGHDPLREGSGNPGATNVYRTAGWSAGLAVLLGDLAKGAVAAGGAYFLVGREVAVLCWAAAVLGHVAPVTRLRQGGKGVATAGGGAFVLYPIAATVLIVVFVLVVRRWRMPSVGSLMLAVLLPTYVAMRGSPAKETACAIAIGLLVLVRHRANVARLLRGDERPVSSG